jgi:osmotically-inducible protein OsmY
MLRRLVKTALPVSRVGAAMFLWRNRDEVMKWAGFVGTALPKIAEGNASDVLAEARLRARLTADARTRGADGLRVSVLDGVATLSGVVDPAIHDVALDLATSSSGISRVRDDLQHARRRPKFAFA